MKRFLRNIFQFAIPVIALVYGAGEYWQWWDHISGRSSATSAYNRLNSNEGYPKIVIFHDEPNFTELFKFLSKRISVPEYDSLEDDKKMPSCIARVGGTLGHELQKQLPPDWPSVRYVPETSPIVFVYGISKEINDKKGAGFRVCSLGDLRRWIEEYRNAERFWVTTFLIGLLSITLILLDLSKPNKER